MFPTTRYNTYSFRSYVNHSSVYLKMQINSCSILFTNPPLCCYYIRLYPLLTHLIVEDILSPHSGVITLNEPLEFDHLIQSFLQPSDLDQGQEGEDVVQASSSDYWWGDGGYLASEVGLLTHNIVIQGIWWHMCIVY